MAEEGNDEHVVNLEDLPPFNSPFPILQRDDLDYNKAQCILKEEDEQIKIMETNAVAKRNCLLLSSNSDSSSAS